MNLFQSTLKRVPFIAQEANGECGLACLAMIGQWHGHRITLPQLRIEYPTTRLGLNLSDLSRIARALRLEPRGLAISDTADLAKVRMPALIHWDTNHFVVLTKVKRGRYTVHNPAGSVADYGEDEFRSHFSGNVLEVEPDDNFEVIVRQKRHSLSTILRQTRGLKKSILQVVVVSLTSSVLILSVPAIVQIALDSVIPKNDMELLQLLAVALFAVSASTGVAEWIQRRVIANAGTSFFAQLTRNAVGHIFRLPISYTESRHPGDIAVRLESIEHVRHVVTNSAVTALVDGIMMLLCGILMFLYIPSLAVMVSGVFFAVVLVRLLMYPALRRQGAIALREKSEERSRLMDSLRASAALKAANATSAATGRWYDSLVKAANAGFKGSIIEANAVLAVELLTALGTALVLFFGVIAVMTQGITVGMLYAFFTYRGIFFDKIDKLVQVMTDLALLGTNMGRLDDFLQMDVEQENAIVTRSIRHGIELRGVNFKVGFADAPIVSDINLKVQANTGAWIVIVGQSGSGKTTLLKLLAGLYKSSSGQQLVDGVDLQTWGLAAYRDNLGLLLGADKLMRGSVSENVTCFASNPDMNRLAEALRISCLTDVVDSLPNRYRTVVSEENGVMSSGQRRRLMLARAIYRDAPILLLDEVTSNLDVETTEQLLENLASLPATKVIATHDDRVVGYCHDLYEMKAGRLLPMKMEVLMGEGASG